MMKGISGAGCGVAAFFGFIPFLFYFQVTLNQPTLGIPLYTLLPTIVLAALMFNRSPRRASADQTGKLLDVFVGYLVVFFVGFVGVNGFLNDVAGMAKTVFFFLAPLSAYYWSSRMATDRELKLTVVVVSLSALGMAANWFYQIFSVRFLGAITDFQQLAFEYLMANTGNDLESLTQIIGTQYRAPGLVESHIHATATCVSIGVFALASFFLEANRRSLLFLAGGLVSVQFLGGARLAALGSVVTFGCYLLLLSRTRLSISATLFGVAVIPAVTTLGLAVYAAWSSAFVDTLIEFYGPLIPGLGGSKDSADAGVFTELAGSEASRIWTGFLENPLVLVTGFGPTALLHGRELASEDFFIIHMVSFYGVFGTGFFVLVVARTVSHARQVIGRLDPKAAALLCFAICVLSIFSVSILHSGVLHRRALWPFFILALGLARRFYITRPSH